MTSGQKIRFSEPVLSCLEASLYTSYTGEVYVLTSDRPHDIPHVYVTTSYVPLKPLICVLYESSSSLNAVYLTYMTLYIQSLEWPVQIAGKQFQMNSTISYYKMRNSTVC